MQLTVKNKTRYIILTCCLFIGLLLIICCDWIVSNNAKDRLFANVEDIPYNKVGLLLATSPITPQGIHNYYFDYRIEATTELYRNGKIDYIIASGGDYSFRPNGYNELTSIRDSLTAYGIPDSVIILDYEGTRTLNSIVKAKEVYQLNRLTIISQDFHNARAIYLADKNGVDAIAYNAETPDILKARLKNRLREYLARVKMFIDLATNKKPHFGST
ncbi:YdcF family protein [Parabacteroides sp. OttesenSCG-928-G21]|nr:YdcF family protein [Parabacteroides sp. OttesenSCG-928-G21]